MFARLHSGKWKVVRQEMSKWLVRRKQAGRVTRRLEKNCQIFERIAEKVAKSKQGQNIYNKAQFESPKHLHQTTYKTLIYLQQIMF